MATGLRQVLDHLQQAGGGLSDRQLLARFVAARDEAAFAALVRRHGPMVLGVCHRVLHDFHDAEDALQATFLVLAKKASSLVVGDSLGCWLHGVAYRAALEAREFNARRRSRERPMNDVPHPEVMPAETKDWMPLLDRELGLLPEKYRAAIVLCDLEGRTRKDAARLLKVPEGTLSSRLASGRQLLAKRLTGCGLALSGGALGVLLAEGRASAAVSASLVSSTARAAALVAAGQVAAVSTTAVLLMKGVMKAMLMKKLRLVVGAVLIVVALGAVGVGYQAGGFGSAQAAPPDKPRNELEALRRENELLKLNLEVVLEKVRAQEAELRELRARGDSVKPRGSGGPGMGSGGRPPVMGGGMPGPGIGNGVPGTGPGGPPAGAPDLPRGNGGYPRPGTGSGGGPPMGASGAIPSRTPGVPGSPSGGSGTPGQPMGGAPPAAGSGAPPARTNIIDPVQEAEAALKALREAKDPESQRRATEALEKALEKLKQQQAAGKKGARGEEGPR